MTQAPTATATLTVTASPTLTITPVPTPVQVVVSDGAGAYARTGPGTDYAEFGIVKPGQRFTVVAYAGGDEGDLWFLVTLPDGQQVWVSGWVVDPLGLDDLARISPAATVPPSPIPPSTDTPTPAVTLPPGADAIIPADSRVNLRSGAGLDFDLLLTLEPGTPLRLIGRNADMTWFQVATFDGFQGWVFAELLTIYRADPANLTQSWVDLAPNAPANAVVGLNAALLPDQLEQARTIYQHGQQVGNRPNSFLLIGDSVDSEGEFLRAFGSGNYDLGDYVYLQATIDFYNQAGAFADVYQTSHTGFRYAMLFDATWSNPAFCEAGETPLDCEYRNKKPSVAIIYLGLNDMRFDTPDSFRYNMTQVIQQLIGNGVIPVVTTFTIADYYEYYSQAPIYLRIMREVAAGFHVPLIDFNERAQPLPNHGTGEDGAHLTFREDRHISFAGDQHRYGTALRELLTLQILDDLRRNVFIPYSP